MRTGLARREPPAALVTDAERSRYDDHRERVRRYLISMGIRTLCFVLAVSLLTGVARLIAIALAVVLPWFAVVFANAGPRRTAAHPTPFVVQGPPALPAGERPAPSEQ